MSESSEPNLSWIAAILRPEAVTSLRTKSDNHYDSHPATRIADFLLSKTQRSQDHDLADAARSNDILKGVELSFVHNTIRDGIGILSEQVYQSAHSDAAQACALTLLACCACGELEDYDKCESLIGAVLDNVQGDSPSDQLIRAILLQQRCLRRRDRGYPFEDDTIAVAKILAGLDAQSLPKFDVNSLTHSSTDTIVHIIDALRWSNWSHISPLRSDQSEELQSVIPPLEVRARFPKPEQVLLIESEISRQLAHLINEQYQSGRSSQTLTFGNTYADIFMQLLRLELIGASTVNSIRKQLGQIRLLRQPDAGARTYFYSDSLRLFRQAGAEAELDIAIEKIKQDGPLSSLSVDVRQVLRRPYRELRTPELRVLRAAADLLSEPEARAALNGLIQVSTPLNRSGYWQAESVRLGALWQTIAELTTAAGNSDIGANYFLDAIDRHSSGDSMIDRNIAHALFLLDWKAISESYKLKWRRWATTSSAKWPEVTAVIADALSIANTSFSEIASVDDVIQFVNGIDWGHPVSTAEVSQAAAILTSGMSKTREAAHRGQFSIGSYDVADIAVLLAAKTGHNELWHEIAVFLIDGSVARSDRTSAFERLARLRPTLPEPVSELYRQSAPKVLESTGTPPFEADAVRPYPAALRFFATSRLIPPLEAFTQIGRLTQVEHGPAEAAATVAVLAEEQRDEWVLAIALQLSYSNDPSARIGAARSLALLANAEKGYGELVSRRLIELLGHDGTMVPMSILKRLPTPVIGVVRKAIISLRDDHPSRNVRLAAEEFLLQE
ncbi:hypothetical protein [Nocardia violaceofusca]|uniref:hypothetical protein n=1 Tax=Nocardia violaceofusca TaxID=941182 RepID=UPI000A4298B3|nr:hypothetical protein [Nocardia violaceofusca]